MAGHEEYGLCGANGKPAARQERQPGPAPFETMADFYQWWSRAEERQIARLNRDGCCGGHVMSNGWCEQLHFHLRATRGSPMCPCAPQLWGHVADEWESFIEELNDEYRRHQNTESDLERPA